MVIPPVTVVPAVSRDAREFVAFISIYDGVPHSVAFLTSRIVPIFVVQLLSILQASLSRATFIDNN